MNDSSRSTAGASVKVRVDLSPDVWEEIARLRRWKGLDVDEALNMLVRRGMKVGTVYAFPDARDMGEARTDVTCTGEVLRTLDEEEGRQ